MSYQDKYSYQTEIDTSLFGFIRGRYRLIEIHEYQDYDCDGGGNINLEDFVQKSVVVYAKNREEFNKKVMEYMVMKLANQMNKEQKEAHEKFVADMKMVDEVFKRDLINIMESTKAPNNKVSLIG